jgi:hypothetical protein
MVQPRKRPRDPGLSRVTGFIGVNVISASPAETSANLEATEPIALILKGAISKSLHSPRRDSVLRKLEQS